VQAIGGSHSYTAIAFYVVFCYNIIVLFPYFGGAMHIYPASFFVFLGFCMLQLIVQTWTGRITGVRRIAGKPSVLEQGMKLASSIFLLAAAALSTVDHTLTWPGIRAAGVAVMLLGLWLTAQAKLELGRNWVGGIGLHEQHKLVTTGPYHLIRHPLYAGMMLSGLGFGLVALNIWMFLFGFCMQSSFAFRIPEEEKLMKQKFKKKYEEYAARTGMLVPRLRPARS
jgi:protein-S-isoprenylcysteine O-methyltransferase Ste14